MALVAGTWFDMGSDIAANEGPVHRVWVDGFEIGACQVTNAEYGAFLEATGHPPPPSWLEPDFADPSQPVVAVSWFDAVRYCEWLSSTERIPYRLPTEAEWECAARGGIEGALYSWGDDLREVNATRWLHGPEPVARGTPNAYGLYDMCENVHEWCSDWYAPDYYRVSPDRNPRGPETGTRRSSRGGSWRHRVKVSRCAARSSIPPSFQYADYGFRIARSQAAI